MKKRIFALVLTVFLAANSISVLAKDTAPKNSKTIIVHSFVDPDAVDVD